MDMTRYEQSHPIAAKVLGVFDHAHLIHAAYVSQATETYVAAIMQAVPDSPELRKALEHIAAGLDYLHRSINAAAEAEADLAPPAHVAAGQTDPFYSILRAASGQHVSPPAVTELDLTPEAAAVADAVTAPVS